MADVMTPEHRIRCMAAMKDKDTKPEMMVRRFLFSKGLRYRVNNRKLSGSPNIVLKILNPRENPVSTEKSGESVPKAVRTASLDMESYAQRRCRTDASVHGTTILHGCIVSLR